MAPERKDHADERPHAGAFLCPKEDSAVPTLREERRHVAPWYVPYLVGGLLEALVYFGVMLFVRFSLYSTEGFVGLFSQPSAFLYPAGILFGLLLAFAYILGNDHPLTQARVGFFAAIMSLATALIYFGLSLSTAIGAALSTGDWGAVWGNRGIALYLITSFFLFVLATSLFFPALDYFRQSCLPEAKEERR